MKIRPVTTEFSHADGPTDGQADRHDEPNKRFTKFCEGA
jgi:hypothetical protein